MTQPIGSDIQAELRIGDSIARVTLDREQGTFSTVVVTPDSIRPALGHWGSIRLLAKLADVGAEVIG